MSKNFRAPVSCRRLVVILGDQLDLDAAVLQECDPQVDWVWMAEVAQESTKVWSHQVRITFFLSAMRHFAVALKEKGFRVMYRHLDDAKNQGSLAKELAATLAYCRPEQVVLTEPGEWDVQAELEAVLRQEKVSWIIKIDRHFLCSREEFSRHMQGRKQLRMEFFYREMRRKTGVLMENDSPLGGSWNFDANNRKSFGKQGPGLRASISSFPPDKITQEVMVLVQKKFKQHPGKLDHFDWPVTREQALEAMHDFMEHRLPDFGAYQDAMWVDEPYLYHSRLSAALNLKLLHPLEVVQAAEAAYHQKHAPLAAVEGFIRQILGWREYVRGIYWHFMPHYRNLNALQATEELPPFFWTGETSLNCLRHAIQQTLTYGYAHHIQRLMVTGLFCLLYGVRPQEVHAWYLAVYLDAVEWVELPNTLGMSQYGDGGIMASKPYVASGKYIQRMSNYCLGCVYDPAQATGPKACPLTTLYWDFLLRHEERLQKNQRMVMQLRNLQRLSPSTRKAIQSQAVAFRKKTAVATG